MKCWKCFQIIQLIFFPCFGVFLFTRTVDGHGTVQIPEIKLISLVIWTLFYLGVLAVLRGERSPVPNLSLGWGLRSASVSLDVLRLVARASAPGR